jgi:hypothetical protein
VNGGNSIWLNADAHYSCQSLETINTSAPQSSTSFMHPISRSPTDILQCIFEIGTQKSQEGFKFATSISHVCQRWRSVVLDNQQLWTYIECSMKKKESSILSFWDRMRRRNKGLPVIIVIQHIGQENSKPLKYCSLDEFPLIERLTFHLSDTESISEIQNLSFAVPVDRIERLELRFLQAMRSYGDWSWRALVGRFHNVKELHLRNAPRIHIERNGDDPTSLAPLPQLESLELVSTELWIPDPLSLRNLRRLNLRGNHRADSWLHQISCPNLTALDVDDDIRHERIMSFLSRHTHITSLHISSWEALGDIATVLPQVQHLTFRDPQMRLEHIPLLEPKSGAYLPALQSLTTWDWQGSLRPHEFEELVRGRCLPSSHPRSLLPIWMKPLKSFIIYHVASLSPDRIPWKRSKFFTEAKCIIEHDEEERIYYILSWI